ncbi:2Fe-2S iron-sulfur cluster-binding protein [Frigidibacter sp. SD6-1]|uniref:2Fe-2S iron-sulfur cluster-binding protein n=1 Tax=Frigidibacter sp. SD6-1 TaxID=3032581 RepID=UPI0024DFA56C|nr:2Fe-2S iron-sulfur cluster-binding protein [Frigidibacter sp. SD6-1]
MATINVKTRDGTRNQFEGTIGLSLMENIRNSGHEELLAMCGGCLSCATCHIYVESIPAGASLPDLSRDERNFLDGLDFRKPESRLACQIPFSAALNGIEVMIAPEE